MAELLAALSLATDLAMAFPPEMALRTCLLAMRPGQALGLGEGDLANIYYVSLLRHVGCTAFSHEEGLVFRNDNVARRDFTGVDVGRPTEVVRGVFHALGPDEGPIARTRTFFRLLQHREDRHLWAAAHCDASMRLANELGLAPSVAEGLNDVFERWDGSGQTRRLRGENISLAARVTAFAHTVVLYLWRRQSPGTADRGHVRDHRL